MVAARRVGILFLMVSSVLVSKNFGIPVRGGVQVWSIRGNTPIDKSQVARPGDEPLALASALHYGNPSKAAKLLMKSHNLDLLEEGIRLLSEWRSDFVEGTDDGSGPDVVAMALATAAMKSGDVQKYAKLAARLVTDKGDDTMSLESLFYAAFSNSKLLERIILFNQGVSNRRTLLGKKKGKNKKNKNEKNKNGNGKNGKKGKKPKKEEGDFEYQCAGCKPFYNHVSCSFCVPSDKCKSRAWCKDDEEEKEEE